MLSGPAKGARANRGAFARLHAAHRAYAGNLEDVRFVSRCSRERVVDLEIIKMTVPSDGPAYDVERFPLIVFVRVPKQGALLWVSCFGHAPIEGKATARGSPVPNFSTQRVILIGSAGIPFVSADNYDEHAYLNFISDVAKALIRHRTWRSGRGHFAAEQRRQLILPSEADGPRTHALAIVRRQRI
jgi:hypothetical protein